jgi:hypothetical protein
MQATFSTKFVNSLLRDLIMYAGLSFDISFTCSDILLSCDSSSVSIETRLRAGGPGFDLRQRQGSISFPSPLRSVRLYGPPSLLSMGTEDGQDLKLTTHLHQVLRLRMGGAIPPLPHTSSLRSA